MNDGSAFASPHSWDTGSAESLISWTSHPDCRVSARARKKRHRQSVGEGDEHRRENYIHEGDQIKEGKEWKSLVAKYRGDEWNRRSARCERQEAADGERVERPEWRRRQRGAVIHRQASRHMASVCRALVGSQQDCLVTRWCCMSRPKRGNQDTRQQKAADHLCADYICCPDSWKFQLTRGSSQKTFSKYQNVYAGLPATLFSVSTCTCLASVCWFPIPEPRTMQPYVRFHNVRAVPVNQNYRITGLEIVLKVFQNYMHDYMRFCVCRKFRDLKYTNGSLQLIGSYSVLCSMTLQHWMLTVERLELKFSCWRAFCMSSWCRVYAGILKLKWIPHIHAVLFNFNGFSSLASVMALPRHSSVGRMVFWHRQSWSQENEELLTLVIPRSFLQNHHEVVRCVFYWNISTTFGCSVMKCEADFSVPLWMNCNNLSDPLLILSVLWFMTKYLAPGLNYFATSAN